MSKKDKQVAPVENVLDVPPTPETTDVTPVQEKMHEQDRMVLELAKSRLQTAEAQSKEALAKKETADVTYRYIVLQLYMKYGLTVADAITENGDIVRGGAVQQGK